MDNYIISDEEEIIDAVPPFPEDYTKDVKVMKINKNTKFGHIIDFVGKQFKNDAVRHVIFEGIGDAADKCISCVEVYKRKAPFPVYQWNALQVARRVTYWNPLVEGMERLKVTVDTPVMYILISREQFPVALQSLSMQCSTDDRNSSHAKTAGGGPKRFTPRKPARQNNWARPSKEEREKQNEERHQLLQSTKD